MKAIFSNYRYYLLTIITAVAIIGLMVVPQDTLTTIQWLWVLLSSKAVAAAAGYLIYRLIKHWKAKDTIPELKQLIEDF